MLVMLLPRGDGAQHALRGHPLQKPLPLVCVSRRSDAGVGSDRLSRGQDVHELQGVVTLRGEQVGGDIEGELARGLKGRQRGDPRNLGQVRDRKYRHGLDPTLGSVDGQLLTLLEAGEHLLADLLSSHGDLECLSGLGAAVCSRCCHDELLKCGGRCTVCPGTRSTYIPSAWYV